MKQFKDLMAQKLNKTQFNRASYCKEWSSFMHRFYFSNSNNPLQGYCSREGQYESEDKCKVLINYILRMFRSGYLDQYHFKSSINELAYANFYDIRLEKKREPQLMFEMKYTYTIWEPSYINDEWERVIQVVEDIQIAIKHKNDQIFEMMKFGTPKHEILQWHYKMQEKIFTKYYIKTPTKRRSEADLFDITKKRFQSPYSLAQFCIDQKRKFPADQVDNFARKYTEKWFSQND